MRRIWLFTLFTFFSIALACAEGNDSQDVLYLKNGHIVRGHITKVVPDETVSIRTASGHVLIFDMAQVNKIEKDSGESEDKSSATESPEPHRTQSGFSQTYDASNYFFELHSGFDYSFQGDFSDGTKAWVNGINATGGSASGQENTNFGIDSGLAIGLRLNPTSGIDLNFGTVTPTGTLAVTTPLISSSYFDQTVTEQIYYAVAEYRLTFSQTHSNLVLGLGYFLADIHDTYAYGNSSPYYFSSAVGEEFSGGTFGAVLGFDQEIPLSDQMFLGITLKGRYANIGQVSSSSATAFDGTGPASMAIVNDQGYSVLIPVTNAGIASHSGTTRYASLDYSGITLDLSWEVRF